MKKVFIRSIASLLLMGYAASADSRVLIDFGPSNDDDGRATASPDINGNYWNSWRPYPGNNPIPNGETFPGTVIDSQNNPTTIGMIMTNSFDSNGIVNGGLLSPSASLLGDMAIDTATEDYWFESTGGAAIQFNGLDAGLLYEFRMFGTRATTDTRITRFTAMDANGSHAVELKTSGSGIGTGGYNGNNDTIVSLAGLVPDSSGIINLDVAIVSGGFAYLNMMDIVSTPGFANSPVPVNGENGIGVNTVLSWNAPSDSTNTSYNVYFGVDGNELELVSEAQGTTEFNPGALIPDTNYQWRVDVTDDSGTRTGMTWSFSTNAKEIVKVYFCGGQSNMQGRGLVSEIPVGQQGPFEDVIAFWREWSDWDSLQTGMGNADKFGPTYIFARDIADYTPDENVAILKYAVDGTDLYSRWRPPSSGGTTGDLYTDFIAKSHYALDKLSLYYEPEIVGMVWFQGSSDSNIEARAFEYEYNLTNFINDIRTEFDVPEIPFIIGKLKVNPDGMAYGNTILKAQLGVDTNVDYTGGFDTGDLTFSDGVHYDTNGVVASGQRFASAMELQRFGECIVPMEFDINMFSTQTGTFFDLKKSDNVYEQVTETLKDSSYSRMINKWSTYVTATRDAYVAVEAYHSANSEGDDFNMYFSTDDITYTKMFTVTKTADDDTEQIYYLPNGIEGVVYVAAGDTNHSAGKTVLDSLYIDRMYIYSKAGCFGSTPGDINSDCIVDIADMAVLAQSWLDCTDYINEDCK